MIRRCGARAGEATAAVSSPCGRRPEVSAMVARKEAGKSDDAVQARASICIPGFSRRRARWPSSSRITSLSTGQAASSTQRTTARARYGRERLSRGVLVNAAAAVWRNSVPMSTCLLRIMDCKPLPVLRLGHRAQVGAGRTRGAGGLPGSRSLGPLRDPLDRLGVGSFPGVFAVQFLLTVKRKDR